MSSEKTDTTPPENPAIDRRTVVKGLGAAALAAAAGSQLSGRGAAQPAAAETLGRLMAGARQLPTRPNIVLLITDQERDPQWWPAGWAAENLPNRQRLLAHGLTFDNAFCSAAMCSPSRATLFTGLYPAQHGMTYTLTGGLEDTGDVTACEPTLRQDVLNMGTMLRSAGYDVQYRGKWHLSKGPTGADSTAEQVAAYGFDGWTGPEVAQDTNPAHFGHGCDGYDSTFAQQAADYLTNVAPTSTKPFLLVTSFGNPHDVLAYAKYYDAGGGCSTYGSPPLPADMFSQGISLPETYSENLVDNFKPSCQWQLKANIDDLLDPLDHAQALNYANFYAFLHTLADELMGTVLDALEADADLYNNTIVIRISDHGEMGMSHGGLRQKAFNIYEETLRVPLIMHNPVLFPNPVQTPAFATLIDLMPTLAAIADVPNRPALPLRGQDLSPIIVDAAANPGNPTVTVQDSVLFTFDDENAGAHNELNTVRPPKNIRCIRTQQYKYAMYFDPMRQEPPQFELYDLSADAKEYYNLANSDHRNSHYNPALSAQMQAQLEAKMTETDTHPDRGSISASGQFQSIAGSYLPEPAVAGTASFTIDCANPAPGGGVPSGTVTFKLDGARIDFSSTDIQAVWVAGSRARCGGTGTNNGRGHFGFELWLRDAGTYTWPQPDGSLAPSPSVLRFRLVNHDEAGKVVYDNADGVAPSVPYGDTTTTGCVGDVIQADNLTILPPVPTPPRMQTLLRRLFLPIARRDG